MIFSPFSFLCHRLLTTFIPPFVSATLGDFSPSSFRVYTMFLSSTQPSASCCLNSIPLFVSQLYLLLYSRNVRFLKSFNFWASKFHNMVTTTHLKMHLSHIPNPCSWHFLFFEMSGIYLLKISAILLCVGLHQNVNDFPLWSAMSLS